MRGLYDGNLAALDAHMDAEDRWLDSRPKCDICGDPIQDEFYYDIDGDKYCEKCKENYDYERRVWIDG